MNLTTIFFHTRAILNRPSMEGIPRSIRLLHKVLNFDTKSPKIPEEVMETDIFKG